MLPHHLGTGEPKSTSARISKPVVGCALMSSNSISLRRPGLERISRARDLADVVDRAGETKCAELSGRHAQFLAYGRGKFGHAALCPPCRGRATRPCGSWPALHPRRCAAVLGVAPQLLRGLLALGDVTADAQDPNESAVTCADGRLDRLRTSRWPSSRRRFLLVHGRGRAAMADLSWCRNARAWPASVKS